jgi:hypothetical protein
MDRIAPLLHNPASQCFNWQHRELKFGDPRRLASMQVSDMQRCTDTMGLLRLGDFCLGHI